MLKALKHQQVLLILLTQVVGFCWSTISMLGADAPPLKKSQAPVAFVQNVGQWDMQAQYCFRSSQGTFWLCQDGFLMDTKEYFVSRQPSSAEKPSLENPTDSIHGHVLRVRFASQLRQEQSVLQGSKKLDGYHNYFLGDNTARWKTNVPLYQEVSGGNESTVFQTRYYVENGSLRYDLIIAAGQDPAQLRMTIEGAESLSISKSGELVMKTSIGDVTQQKLLAYQTIANKRHIVPCTFILEDQGSVRFKCGAYDKRYPLTVDPIIWSTYLGGVAMALTGTNGQNTEDCFDITTDAAGNPVVVGTTETNDFPTTLGAYKRVKLNLDDTVSYTDIFITKFNVSGTSMIFSTYLGGRGSEWGRSIRLDNSDTIFICGGTNSGDFPTTAGAYSQNHLGTSDAIVCKINPTGTSLVASTLIGGPDFDQLLSLKVNASGVYVCGWTFFDGYPTTVGAFQSSNTKWWSCVATVFNKSLSGLLGSTYIGGRGTAFDLALDASGNMFITGVEIDSIPTTTNAYSRTRNGIFADAYLVQLNQNCTSLLYGTYIGGESEDIGYGVCLDASGNVIVCGRAESDNFPTTAGAYDRTYNYIRNSSRTGDPYDDFYDGFVAKFAASTMQLQYSTYIGGRSSDWFRRVVAGPGGSAILCGISYSPDYPATACCIDSTQNGIADCVLTILNPTGNVVTYSTFLGGGGTDVAYSLTRLANGHVYVCGSSWDKSFPITVGSYQTVRKLTDAFVMRVDPSVGLCVNAGNDIMYSCTGFGAQVFLAAVPQCGIPPYTYSWTPTTNLSDPTSDKPVTFTTPTGIEYQVKVTDAAGSVAVNTVSLVPLLLNVIPGRDTVVCWGRNARLTTKVTGGMGPKKYSWFPASGLDSANIANPLANPDTTTRYLLIVTDTAGCSKSDTVIVFISRSQLKSSRDTTLCGLKTVKLSPRIEGGIKPLAFRWTSKGSAVLSTSATPTFTLDSTTMYYLTISDSLNCTSRDSILVRYSPPTTLTLSSDSVVCKGANLSVKLSIAGGKAPYAIRWKASDSSLTLGGRDSLCTAIMRQTTTFTATVIDSFGCTTVKNIVVKVDSASSPRIATEGNKKAICSGASLQLDAGSYSGVSYSWSTGEKTQKIRVQTEGWYTVSVTNKNNCVGVDSVFVKVQNNPKATLANPKDTTICEGGSAILRVNGSWSSIRWFNGIMGPQCEVSSEGVFYATVVDSLGCTGITDSVQVHINRMKSSLQGPNSLCAGVSGSFHVDSNAEWTYEWSVLHGGTFSGGTNRASVNIHWDSQGFDTVVAKIKHLLSGCELIYKLPVSINSTLSPTIAIVGSPVLCGSSTVKLQAPSGYDKYLWSNGESTPSITVNTAGTYTVFVESGGCSGRSSEVVVSTAPAIRVAVQGDTVFCAGSEIVISADPGFAHYVWSTGDTSVTIRVRQSGSYTVVVRDTNGCEASATQTCRVLQTSLPPVQSLQFSDQLVTQSATLKLGIPNSSGYPLRVKSVTLLSAPSAFSIVSTNPQPPAILQPNQSLETDISFRPTALDLFGDTLVVIVDAPCPDTLRIALSGRGTKDSISAKVWMTNVQAEIQENVSLPVYCQFSTNRDYNGVDLELSVRMNAYIFFPQSVSSGTIVSNTVAGRERTLTIQMTNVNVRSGEKLCEVLGMALADRDTLTLTHPHVRWIKGLSASTTDSAGSLLVNGCKGDHFNIESRTTMSLKVSPNPANPDLHLDLSSSIQSNHLVQVYSVSGELMFSQTLSPKPEGLQYDHYLSDLSSGVYFVFVTSGNQHLHERVTVIR